jgi:hypothetical protein
MVLQGRFQPLPPRERVSVIKKRRPHVNEIEELSIATLLGGAVIERINDELAKLSMNVVDPNTQATAKREVNVKICVKPEKDRSMGAVEIAVTSKLAPADKMGTRLFISLTKAGPVMTEYNPNQLQLPEVLAASSATVTPLRAVGGSNA